MKKICNQCGKEYNGRESSKCCSKECADKYKTGKTKYVDITVKCEYCGKEFVVNSNPRYIRRFCNLSCVNHWKYEKYGPVKMSEEAKQKNREFFKKKWQDPDFRNSAINRMKNDNPVYKNGVTEKAKRTRLLNGGYKNYFKYGNGKISHYESIVYEFLTSKGYLYNFAINTRLARTEFPDKHYAKSYKPDFVNLNDCTCIEIDGNNHKGKKQQEIDKKKEECLRFLGFTTIRFTHEQIDNGEIYVELNKLWGN